MIIISGIIAIHVLKDSWKFYGGPIEIGSGEGEQTKIFNVKLFKGNEGLASLNCQVGGCGDPIWTRDYDVLFTHLFASAEVKRSELLVARVRTYNLYTKLCRQYSS